MNPEFDRKFAHLAFHIKFSISIDSPIRKIPFPIIPKIHSFAIALFLVLLLFVDCIMSYFHFDQNTSTMFRPWIPKIRRHNAQIITIRNEEGIQKSVMINFEEGDDYDYDYCKGSAKWPEDKDTLKCKDKVVVYRIDFDFRDDGREIIWSVDTPKKDQIATPKDLQHFSFEKIEYSKATDSLVLLYVNSKQNLPKEEAIIMSVDLVAPSFNPQFTYVNDFDNLNYQATHVTVPNQTWEGKEGEGRAAAEQMLPPTNSFDVLERLSMCVDLIDHVIGDRTFPFDYLPNSHFIDQFHFFSSKDSLYVWDQEEGTVTKVGKLPKMAACEDFTTIDVFKNEQFAKLFVFINPHLGENMGDDDCTIDCCVGWFWSKKQEAMVYQILSENRFPKCLVQKVLDFVR